MNNFIFLDIGNSRIKLYYIKDFHIIEVKYLSTGFLIKNPDTEIKNKFFQFSSNKLIYIEYPIIISSVVPLIEKKIINSLNELKLKYKLLSHSSFKGIEYEYKKDNLGIDRIISSLGAVLLFKRDAVVIDMGTAFTVSLMTANKVFKGGAIFGGYNIVKKELIEHSSQLSDFIDIPNPKFPGIDTITSLQNGFYYGYYSLLKYFFNRSAEFLNKPIKILCGGGIKIFKDIGFIDYYSADFAAEAIVEIVRQHII